MPDEAFVEQLSRNPVTLSYSEFILLQQAAKIDTNTHTLMVTLPKRGLVAHNCNKWAYELVMNRRR